MPNTAVTIIVSRAGPNVVPARVISFTTSMEEREVFQSLSVMKTLLSHYHEVPHRDSEPSRGEGTQHDQ